ncbi:MAG: glutamate-semialdehyde -aminomutase [Pseudonocardiales bacterium]|jgi:glutamate-1-semialdehyde 2,1-aminomutase|nr:glutamate-semialdehyde -aminomutase [Pseudonocardiales bacterium]
MNVSSLNLADYYDDPLARRARAVMPSGNTRTTVFVPPAPPFAELGDGPWLVDQRRHRVIDCNNNYTALIHGHCHRGVHAAIKAVLGTGTAFGLPTESEVALAEHLTARTGIDRWRFSNSGTEAVMTALRGARAFTGRDLIIRFDGSYHGTADAVVDENAAGIPSSVAAASIAVPQSDSARFDAEIEKYGERIAAVIIDLMPNRAGLDAADRDFVQHIRTATRAIGALLIVDEVITFRLATGGLHKHYGVEPDLITLGKVIGGGFPVGAVGGTRDVMSIFDPLADRSVGWGGTFSANPVSMTAGLVALRAFGPDQIERLNRQGDDLRVALVSAGVAVSGHGSLARIRESVDPKELWWALYGAGVLAGTNGLLALSTPMSDDDVRQIADGVTSAVSRVKNKEPAS